MKKLLTLLVFLPLFSSAQVITTFAGNNSSGFSGDGGPASAAQLYSPHDIAIDALGNVYIGDAANNLVRKVNASGIISTVAGNGVPGFSGDGGPATDASLSDPLSVAVDNYCNLYIADANNACIRKVNTSGIITTIAGIDTCGHWGDGGPATAAILCVPASIVVDFAGNILFSEANRYIRKISTSGIVTTVAGNGGLTFSGDGGPATAASLNNVIGVAVDHAGNLYIADQVNQRIRKVDTSGIISTIAGTGTAGYSGDGGPATAAMLNYPVGVSVDNDGNLFVSEVLNYRIRKINPAGIITTIAGDGTLGYTGDGGPATAAELFAPFSARSDNMGHLYIADGESNVIRKVTGLPVTPFYLASITGVDTLCLGASATLSDSTAFGAWSSGSTGVATIGTDGTVTGISTGTTVITYTDGGTYTTIPIYVISCPTETQTLPEQNKVSLYPNPAITQLTILSADKPINHIVISNLIGQSVLSNVYNARQIQIDVSDLPTGVYLVKINNVDVRKFVKE